MITIQGSCTRKRAYATRSEAKQAKRVMFQAKKERFKTYKCCFCGFFHIAHRR